MIGVGWTVVLLWHVPVVGKLERRNSLNVARKNDSEAGCRSRHRALNEFKPDILKIETPIACRTFVDYHHQYFLGKPSNPSCIMDASIFGRSSNENTTSSIEDRYNTTKPILNLLSTSRNRIHTENERTNKPLDHSGAFSLQLSNLKLSKRLDKNNPILEPSDRACAPVPFMQPQRRLSSQVPPRVSAPYVSTSTSTNSSLIPAALPLAPINPQKTNNNSSDRTYFDVFFFRLSLANIHFRCFFPFFDVAGV